jgi:hypothetical protein
MGAFRCKSWFVTQFPAEISPFRASLCKDFQALHDYNLGIPFTPLGKDREHHAHRRPD